MGVAVHHGVRTLRPLISFHLCLHHSGLTLKTSGTEYEGNPISTIRYPHEAECLFAPLTVCETVLLQTPPTLAKSANG